LQGRFSLEQIRQTDGGTFQSKPGIEEPTEGEPFLTRGIPEGGGEAFDKQEEAGGTAVELGPDEELLSLEYLLGSVAGQMNFETAG